ncbi:MAG: tetratricopeptide repeat protein [candidate division Zixibacteria bacterium]|nr:tetratricopeptide repeat protein [Candidatus Tariuqbacter arcticus]
MKFLFSTLILIILISTPILAQTETVTDSTLKVLLKQRDNLKQQMTAANEAGDYDKYKELEGIWNELEVKISERQELITKSKKEAKRLLDDASSFRRDKKYAQAQASYEKVLGYREFISESLIPEIKRMIAFCLEMQKKYPQAAEVYSEVIDLDPAKAEAYAGKGRVLGKMGKDSEAINLFKKAIEIKPDDAKNYFFLAKSYDSIKMYKEAEENYSAATEKDAEYYKAFYQLGVVRFKLNKYDDAITALQSTVNIRNNYYNAYTLMAQIYNTIGKYSDALNAAESAINIKSNYAQAHFEKGVALFKSERYNQAIKAFENCMQDRKWQSQAQWHINLIKDKYLQQ